MSDVSSDNEPEIIDKAEAIAAKSILFNGHYPTPTTRIAQTFNNPIQDQIKHTNALAKYIITNLDNKENPIYDFHAFNSTDCINAVPFIIAPQSTRKIRVVYGCGTGQGINGIEECDIEQNLMALVGEISTSNGLPEILTLDKATPFLDQVPTPTDVAMKNKLEAIYSKKVKLTTPWLFKTNEAKDQKWIPQIIPIPAFLVFDGFDKDLDAIELYERVINTEERYTKGEAGKHWLPLVKNFLKATMVNRNNNDATVHTYSSTFLARASPDAIKWRRKRITSLFPQLAPSATPTLSPTTTSTTRNIDPEQLAEIVATAVAKATTKTTSTTTEHNNNEEPTSTTLGLSTSAFKKLLTYSGLLEGQEDMIPELWTKLAESHLSKSDKAAIVKEQLASKVYYRSDKVSKLASLVQMIVQRNFEGEESMSSLTSAAKGLTPFAVPHLSESQIDEHNELAEAINAATATTIKDITTTKFKASAPSTFHGLLRQLKRYSNLLYALFEDTCPLLLQLHNIIEQLEEYTDLAKNRVTKEAIAAILWITHGQSRHFAAGKMKDTTSPNSQIPAFTLMINDIAAKREVKNWEMPKELYEERNNNSNGKRQTGSTANNSTGNNQQQDNKRPRWGATAGNTFTQVVTRNCGNAKILHAMKVFKNRPRKPPIKEICAAANCTIGQIFPKPEHRNICFRAHFWGECTSDCSNKHITLSEDDASNILNLLGPVIRNPNKVRERSHTPFAIRSITDSNKPLVRKLPPLPPKPPTKRVQKPTVPAIATVAAATKRKQTSPASPAPTQGITKPNQHVDVLALAKTQEYGFITKATLQELVRNSKIFPATIPIKDDIGKCGLMWPRGLATAHPAAPLLNWYSDNGCPVDCGKPWSKDQIIAAIKRGAHISAKSPLARQCLLNETMEKQDGNFAKIIKFGDIINNIPKHLKISPVAMIPHKSRHFRTILDLSFNLRFRGSHIPSVNDSTNQQAPQKSMANLGHTLKRLIHLMAANHCQQHPFQFSKVDIKDGFWRMVVNTEDAWNFCYTLPPETPDTPLEDIQLVVPSSLQMGWCESPPFFCAATETARDVIEVLFKHLQHIPAHPLEHHITDRGEAQAPAPPTLPITIFEVYVDDFISATNDLSPTNIERAARAMLHGIHSVFPPTSVTNHNGGDPASEKKLLQGEGRYDFTKEILGWIFDGRNFTIYLPKAKTAKINKAITAILANTEVTLKDFQSVTGKLIHASIGLPAGKGLLSPVYNALTKHSGSTSLRITAPVAQALRDWKVLLQRISSRPTSVLELVPGAPAYVGYVDASGFGAGGVWLSLTTPQAFPPTVWRVSFPADIIANLVSSSNPRGKLTNSDLEMAALLLAWLALEDTVPDTSALKHNHVALYSDNTPTVAWATRLTSSSSTVAGHLLRALALRQHVLRTSPALTVSIKGELNVMADEASRSFKLPFYANSQQTFLHQFNSKFTLPTQTTSWQECRLHSKLSSRVMSCLRGQQLDLELWIKIPQLVKNTGPTGPATHKISRNPPTSTHAPNSSKSSSSPVSLHGSGLATTVAASRLKLRPLQTRLQPSPRPSNWLASPRQSTKQQKLTSCQWHGSWRATAEQTPSQCHSLHSQSQPQKNVKEQVGQANAPNSKQLEISPSLHSTISSEWESTPSHEWLQSTDNVSEQQEPSNSP